MVEEGAEPGVVRVHFDGGRRLGFGGEEFGELVGGSVFAFCFDVDVFVECFDVHWFVVFGAVDGEFGDEVFVGEVLELVVAR